MWTYKEHTTGEEQIPTGFWTVTTDDGQWFDVEEELAMRLVDCANQYFKESK